MPNVVAVLKAEICRLAKKEAKSATNPLKRASVQYRSDIAKLRKQLGQQARLVARLKRELQERRPASAEEGADEPLGGMRFSARSVKAQRKRLGLSAQKYAKLLGVSALTIYSWESGKTRPRQAQFAALVAARGIGKREAARRLEALTPKKRRAKK